MARYEFTLIVDVEPDAVDGDPHEAVQTVFEDATDYTGEALDGIGKVVTGSFTRLADLDEEQPPGGLRRQDRVRHLQTGVPGTVTDTVAKLNPYDGNVGPWALVRFDTGPECWCPFSELERIG